MIRIQNVDLAKQAVRIVTSFLISVLNAKVDIKSLTVFVVKIVIPARNMRQIMISVVLKQQYVKVQLDLQIFVKL